MTSTMTGAGPGARAAAGTAEAGQPGDGAGTAAVTDQDARLDALTEKPARTAPIVGVTTYLEQARTGVWNVRSAVLPEVYLKSVTDAGGIAVLLPPQPPTPEAVERVLHLGIPVVLPPHPRTHRAPARVADTMKDLCLAGVGNGPHTLSTR